MAKVHQRAKKKTPTQHVPLISEALTVIYLLFGIHPVLMFSPFKCRAVAYFCVRSPVWSQDRDGSESGNWQRNQKKVCAPSPHQRRLLKPRLLLNSLSLRHVTRVGEERWNKTHFTLNPLPWQTSSLSDWIDDSLHIKQWWWGRAADAAHRSGLRRSKGPPTCSFLLPPVHNAAEKREPQCDFFLTAMEHIWRTARRQESSDRWREKAANMLHRRLSLALYLRLPLLPAKWLQCIHTGRRRAGTNPAYNVMSRHVFV